MVLLYTYDLNYMHGDRVSYAGGFVGLNTGLMQNSDNYGSVVVWEAPTAAGNGLYGLSTGTEDNCHDYGDWYSPNSGPPRSQALNYFNDLRNRVKSRVSMEESFFRATQSSGALIRL